MTLPPHRHIAVALCAVACLAACTSPTGPRSSAPQGQAAPTELSPAQALGPQALGLKVRWSGGVNAIRAEENGRQCFLMLVATFDATNRLDWPREPGYFFACGPGTYDPALVAQFSLLTLSGRVAGEKQQWGKPVPVIEIDALYRHTDCTQGEEHVAGCYAGYLQPQRQ